MLVERRIGMITFVFVPTSSPDVAVRKGFLEVGNALGSDFGVSEEQFG